MWRQLDATSSSTMLRPKWVRSTRKRRFYSIMYTPCIRRFFCISWLYACFYSPYSRNIPAIETCIIVQIQQSSFLRASLPNGVQETYNILFVRSTTRCKLLDFNIRQRMQLDHFLLEPALFQRQIAYSKVSYIFWITMHYMAVISVNNYDQKLSFWKRFS
jgi:hypothetical protein